MQERKRRLHGYDPVLDRMDRRELVRYFHRHYPEKSDADLNTMTRNEMIDAILDAASGPRNGAPEDSENYPLRRPENRWSSSLNTKNVPEGSTAYWCWEEDVRAFATELAADQISDRPWSLGDGVEKGTLAITVLATNPPLLVCVETVEDVTKDLISVERLAAFSNPISVKDIELRTGITLPRQSQLLSAEQTQAVFEAVDQLVENPAPIFVKPGVCAPREHSELGDALFTIATLQSDGHRFGSCQVCGRTDNRDLEIDEDLEIDVDRELELEVHVDSFVDGRMLLEIQDCVDDTTLVCADCHAMLHKPRVEEVRAFAKPVCPACEHRNPRRIVWGEPILRFNEPEDDELVFAGCVIGQYVPRWECRNCETRYLVVNDKEAQLIELGMLWSQDTAR